MLACIVSLGLACSAPAQLPRPGGVASGRVGPHLGQEHLSQWMERHRDLSLPEQQRALEQEPGFHELAPPLQQRMRDRLTQLNNMAPQQRQHLLDRAEAMEHLSPQQRQQVRSAMLQLSNLPVDRRRIVSRAFRDVRETPPEQRERLLSSERFRTQLSEQEQGTLSSLIAVERYLPQPRNLQMPASPYQSPKGYPEQPLPSQGFQPQPHP